MKKGFNDTRYRAVCGDPPGAYCGIRIPMHGVLFVCAALYTMMDACCACSTKTPYSIRRMMDVDSARVSATHARAALDEAFGRPSRRCW